MKQTLIHHRIEFLIAFVALVVVLFISLYSLEYTLTAPGLNNEVGDFITIEDAYDNQGSLYTTSVIALNRVTILQYWIAQLEDKVEIAEYPEYYSTINVSDLRVTGSISHDDSLIKSLVVGISKTSYSITYSTDPVVYLTYNYLDEDTLVIGDILLSVNGDPDVYSAFSNATCNETSRFVVLRGDEELTFDVMRHELDDGCAFGLYVRDFYAITNTNVSYVLHDSNTGGSSGGLMQSLYVFNQLTPNDITGGLKIAGTGTINIDGSVGAIAGIRQKIITSVMNGMDVFFVPHLSDSETDNYIVALQTLEELHSDMVLVPVTTFDDALSYLEGRFGGAFDE